MATLEEQKDSIRTALQVLCDYLKTADSGECIRFEVSNAMHTLFNAFDCNFRSVGTSSPSVDVDDTLQNEMFSMQVVEAVLEAAKKANRLGSYHQKPHFFAQAFFILDVLGRRNPEYAQAFISRGGMELALTCMELFSSDEAVAKCSFRLLYFTVCNLMEELKDEESLALVQLVLATMGETIRLGWGHAAANVHLFYCGVLSKCLWNADPSHELKDLLTKFFMKGMQIYKTDAQIQKYGRCIVGHLMGEDSEYGQQLIRAEHMERLR